jgi:hypothetical protein
MSSRLSGLVRASFGPTSAPNPGNPGRRGRQPQRRWPVATIALTIAAGLSAGAVTAWAGPAWADGLYAAADHAPATASTAAPSPVLGSSLANVSLSQVQSAIDNLYRAHPGIASFVVQDVEYPTQSRDVVLKACTKAQGPSVSQADETGQLLACAPLVFFLYSYGREKSVAAALQAANELYSYVTTHTTGPASPETVLGGVLRSWGLPVSGDPVSSAPVNSPGETSLVDGASSAIMAEGSVHLLVLGYQGNSKRATEKIVADVGPGWASESLTAGKATASIRVTPKAAYFSGNNAGLTTLIGLNAAAAKKAGSHWVTMKKGTSEYKDFVMEETIGSVPATVLPASGSSVKISTSVSRGRPVNVLTWQATVSGPNNQLSETLVLSGTARPLPVTEVTRADGDHETANFSDWGEKVTVAGPPATTAILTPRSPEGLSQRLARRGLRSGPGPMPRGAAAATSTCPPGGLWPPAAAGPGLPWRR